MVEHWIQEASQKKVQRCSPQEIQRVYLQSQPRKAKTCVVTADENENVPLVTDSLICDTKHMLLAWDFSSTNETMKIETTKAPMEQDLL